jgi:recombination endonuclease VII
MTGGASACVFNSVQDSALDTADIDYQVARERGYARPNFIPPHKSAVCDLCQREKELVADHCHTTGIFRGWLCPRCNYFIALTESDLAIKAQQYLASAATRSEELRARQPARRRFVPGEPGGVGRPRLLTPDLISAVEQASDVAGVLRVLSAAGVARRTSQTWRTLGRKGIPPYDAFVKTLAKHGLDRPYSF